SRRLPAKEGGYTVGVLLQCNHGERSQLRIAGVPVGKEITQNPVWASAASPARDMGSIIVVVATDAPLLPHQLKRIAKRVTLGLGRNGAIAGNGSGDIFIAFSTANPGAFNYSKITHPAMMANDQLDTLFEATVQAVEEAEVNAMVAAKTMVGRDGHTAVALPHEELRTVLKKYNRLER
ncbi:MAG TPA: P1 family peptidase, partial [Terriglobales bacterium]|nr:P1 family peptidase [Terriglobales bacterium]